MIDAVIALFRAPSPEELIARELVEARRAKLAAETAVEYAKSMVAYNDARIKRLTNYETPARKD